MEDTGHILYHKNLEVKYKVNNFGDVIVSLSNYFDCILSQKDTYYVVPNGRLKLREEAKVILDGKQELTSHFIRYYRPDDAEKISIVHKYYIDDIKNFQNVFGDIMKEEVVVKKTRMLFLYKNARIHLDNVITLHKGSEFYIEIEVVIKNEEEDFNSKLLLNELIVLMKLEKSTIIHNSYRELQLQQDKYNFSV